MIYPLSLSLYICIYMFYPILSWQPNGSLKYAIELFHIVNSTLKAYILEKCPHFPQAWWAILLGYPLPAKNWAEPGRPMQAIFLVRQDPA